MFRFHSPFKTVPIHLHCEVLGNKSWMVNPLIVRFVGRESSGDNEVIKKFIKKKDRKEPIRFQKLYLNLS